MRASLLLLLLVSVGCSSSEESNIKCSSNAECPSGTKCQLPPLVPDSIPNVCAN